MANRKSKKHTIATAGWWLLEQDLVAGAGLDSWYKTGIRWIGVRWFRTGICWCRKVFTGPGLVVAGICWYRKLVAGSGLAVAGAELAAAGAGKCTLVSAGAGKWSLVQEGDRWCRTCGNWCRTGSCWYLLVQESGRWCLLVQEGGRWCRTGSCWCRTGSCWCRTGSCYCREMAVGVGVVVAARVRWSSVQEWLLPLQWCGRRRKKVSAGTVSKSLRLSALFVWKGLLDWEAVSCVCCIVPSHEVLGKTFWVALKRALSWEAGNRPVSSAAGIGMSALVEALSSPHWQLLIRLQS